MKISISQFDIDEAVRAEDEWYKEHPNTQLIIGRPLGELGEKEKQMPMNRTVPTLDDLKVITKDLTNQQKIALVESWNWDVQTDGSENEQICIYTGIVTK